MGMAAESMAAAGEGRRYPSPLVKQDLAKLGKDAESRRAALASLRNVVEEHLQGSALLRFLHQVEDSADGRHHAATIVTDIARVHGDRLSPHIPRLLQILGHTLLASAASPGLQSDCAKAVAAIAKHSASQPPSAEHVLRRLCLPLIALLPHKVELLSAGAAACLSALVDSEAWKFAAAPLVSKLCLRAAMALTSKSAHTVPHMNLLRSLASANASALGQFSIPLLRLLNQEIMLSPSASWQLRLAAIHVMESLLKAAEQTTLASQLAVSFQTLAKCRLDKMPHVRKAAMNALRTADALAAKGDIMKRKPAEDHLPQFRSQTEPSSPVRHNLESIGNIEDLFKPSLSSPGSQRSHGLFLSPRTLSDLAINASPSSKQIGIHTPLSDNSPGRDTTDDSDYFCAYFFDTKENVSCRKIVHHIHDTATGSGTPPNSPPRQGGRKVVVPPLPLSSVVHDSGRQAFKGGSVNPQSQSAASTPSSFTRHVTVLDSHAELLASCERSLIFSASCAEGNATHQDSAQAMPEIRAANAGDQDAERKKPEVASDLEFSDKFAKSRIEQISAEQRMQAMEDLQAISSRLLEIREGEEAEEEEEGEEEAAKGKEDRDEQQKQISTERQGRIEALCKDLTEFVGAETASSLHEAKESCAGKEEEEAAESNSVEWSVRDNPIAEAQAYQGPASEETNAGRGTQQEIAGESAYPSSDAGALMELPPGTTAPPAGHGEGGDSDQESTVMEEYEEAEAEALESCEGEASELAENEQDTEALETCRSSSRETDEREGGRPDIDTSVCRRSWASLRRFLMCSSACVIAIAMVTTAKLFQVELLPQQQYTHDSNDIFMPPT